MARYTAAIALPAQLATNTSAGLSSCLSQAIQSLGLEVIQSTRVQLVANDPGPRNGPSIRILFSWSQQQSDDNTVVVAIELLSRESMGTGAPVTHAAMGALLSGLAEQLGDLQVLSDSRSISRRV